MSMESLLSKFKDYNRNVASEMIIQKTAVQEELFVLAKHINPFPMGLNINF